MSDQKTPEQVAQEAQEGLNKIITAEAQKLAQQHITVVQLRTQAVQFALKLVEGTVFHGNFFEYADDMLKYLATGEYKKDEPQTTEGEQQ